MKLNKSSKIECKEPAFSLSVPCIFLVSTSKEQKERIEGGRKDEGQQP
jgi:hypothetical protein